ncbi:MAG: hypothetical protein IPI68_09360 [Chitinophagaceae bacterium]|nr:hypothetical protein [Chitinophagaceae bacterium]
MMGAGFSKRTFGFRNLPYATDQKLSALYAFDRKAYQIRYRGEFNHITRSYDLILQGNYANPALRNFTGLGNNTKTNPANNFDYYRTRYKFLELEALYGNAFLKTYT